MQHRQSHRVESAIVSTHYDSLRASAQEALLALTRCAERELAVEAALAGMGVNGQGGS